MGCLVTWPMISKSLSTCRTVSPASSAAGGDDQVADGGGAVLAPVGQQGQDLNRAILDRRGQVFDGHGGQRRPLQPYPQIWAGPG